MDILIVPFLILLKSIIGLMVWVIIVDVIVGWLIIANIFNTNNSFVYSIIEAIRKTSDLLLDPIRRRIPMFGTMDASPIIVILLLTFLENVVSRIMIRMM